MLMREFIILLVTFRVCFGYIVLFLALLSFCVPFCSTSRSVFIGWLDCQSSFWRHDVLPICWRASCIWGLELIVCVCAMPAYPVLQRGQQFVFDTNCLPMLNVSCLMSHALCCAMWSIYRFVLWLLICIEFFVEDNADARIGVSVLLCQVQS